MLAPIIQSLLWTSLASIALPQQIPAPADLETQLDLWSSELTAPPPPSGLTKPVDPWDDTVEGHHLSISSYDQPTVQRRVALDFLENLRQYIIEALRDIRRHQSKEKLPDPDFVGGRLRYNDPVHKISVGLIPVETPPPAPGPFVPLKFSQIIAVGRMLVRWVSTYAEMNNVPSAKLRLFEGGTDDKNIVATGSIICGLTDVIAYSRLEESWF